MNTSRINDRADLLIADGVPHVEGVIFQAVLGLDALLVLLVLALVLLGILHHPLDLVLAQSTLVISNCDLVLLACGLVLHVIAKQSACMPAGQWLVACQLQMHTDANWMDTLTSAADNDVLLAFVCELLLPSPVV